MRLVIQRVNHASVEIDGVTRGKIGRGLCIFMGVERGADEEDLSWLVKKTINLRIFSDGAGKMNRSVVDEDGDILLISQFTLHASTRKGNRPSFITAEEPERAERLYETFLELLEQTFGKKIHTGSFGADMKISLENDGPVTILIDSVEKW